jgi:hypothetical protein
VSDQTNLNLLEWLLQAETRPFGAPLTRGLSSFMDATMSSVRRDLPVTCPFHVRARLCQAPCVVPTVYDQTSLFQKAQGPATHANTNTIPCSSHQWVALRLRQQYGSCLTQSHRRRSRISEGSSHPPADMNEYGTEFRKHRGFGCYAGNKRSEKPHEGSVKPVTRGLAEY